MDESRFLRLRSWGQNFIDKYLKMSVDEEVLQSLRLKAEHTLRVEENIIRLSKSLLLNEEETYLARAIALCHDLGRFPQYHKYRTFRDASSINHGTLSAEIIETSGMLDDLSMSERRIILESVRFHNSPFINLKVKKHESSQSTDSTDDVDINPEKRSLYISLIRDADKLDIWRVFSESMILPAQVRPQGAMLSLEDTPGVSDAVIQAIKDKRMALLKDVRNQNDFRLLQLSWVFDLNFRASFRLLKERDYFSVIGDIRDQKAYEVVSFVKDYIEKRLDSKVYFIGAGPGDPELLTLKARRILDSADVVIYAGSLINPETLKGLNAECYDSSGMNLDEIIDIIWHYYNRAKTVVRLHSGDLSIYSAINEQIERLKEMNIEFEAIPGVSSFQAGSAILGHELTIPEISQTVILTRLEGRTPVPETERLSELAKHRSTMVIFLSVGMIKKVKEELLEGYPGNTPVVVIEKVTWPDQRVIRGNLKDLDLLVTEAGIKKTALIYVGESLKASETPLGKESKLYDKDFKHEYRK